jgi:hypothetical protein
MVFMRAFLVCITLFLPLFSFAAPSTIYVRQGNTTPAIKYHLDTSSLQSALAQGVNNRLEVTVNTHHKAADFAVRFASVQAFDEQGAPVGPNVADEDKALLTSPRNFVFDNFPLSDEELMRVAGISISFFPVGGGATSGDLVTVSNVAFVLRHQKGEACIISDPFLVTVPPEPVRTVRKIQESRPLVQPGTHGDGGSGGGSGSFGPYYAGAATNNGGGVTMWSNPENARTDDGTSAMATSGINSTTANLDLTEYGFSSIPSTATITGIVAVIKRNVSPGSDFKDLTIMLVNGALAIGSNKADTGTSWPVSPATATYGGVSDTWGGVTTDQVRHSSFGLRIAATIAAPNSGFVNFGSVTVYYTTGASVYNSFMDLIRALMRRFI